MLFLQRQLLLGLACQRSCGEITVGGSADCDNLPVGGTRERILLANINDIDSITETDGVITAISMVSGKTFFEYEGFRNDVQASEEMIKPDVGLPKFKHTTRHVVYERTQAQKNNLEKKARGRLVAIIERKGKDNTSFELYGKEVGLALVAGPMRHTHENGSYFIINLATPDDEGELEPRLPQTIFDTDYSTTLALVNALLPSS